MNSTVTETPFAAPVATTVAGRPAVRKLIDTLATVRFAMLIIVALVLACSAGTILPQGNEAARYLQQNPEAAQRMKLFGTLGLTDVYHSWWFVGLLCLLASSMMACTTRRFASARRTTGFARRRAIGSMLTHISMLLILAGGVVRAVWGVKGYLALHEGQTSAQFQVGNTMQDLPFRIQLEDFSIITYADDEEEAEAATESPAPAALHPVDDKLVVQWPTRQLSATLPVELGHERNLHLPGNDAVSVYIKVLRYVPDFVMDEKTREITSRSDQANNPAILVAVKQGADENQRWVFAKFPEFTMHAAGSQGGAADELKLVYQASGAGATMQTAAVRGPVKSYKSTVKVIEGDQAVQTPVIEVNRPFRYQGYTFYQTGYNPKDLTWTSFQVVRDPGVPMVYAGFAVMIIGLFIVFYLNPWMESRRSRA